MNTLFGLIKTQLITKLKPIYSDLYVAIYNNQFEQQEDGSTYSFPSDRCIFVEFECDSIQQLGGGYQIYDPLKIRFHYGFIEYDAMDGTMEQNLNVFDFTKEGFKALQKFQPDGCVHFVRTAEFQDKAHTNMYHFVQEYVTNYIDQNKKEPIDGIESTPPTELILDRPTFDPDPYTKTLP